MCFIGVVSRGLLFIFRLVRSFVGGGGGRCMGGVRFVGFVWRIGVDSLGIVCVRGSGCVGGVRFMGFIWWVGVDLDYGGRRV